MQHSAGISHLLKEATQHTATPYSSMARMSCTITSVWRNAATLGGVDAAGYRSCRHWPIDR